MSVLLDINTSEFLVPQTSADSVAMFLEFCFLSCFHKYFHMLLWEAEGLSELTCYHQVFCFLFFCFGLWIAHLILSYCLLLKSGYVHLICMWVRCWGPWETSAPPSHATNTSWLRTSTVSIFIVLVNKDRQRGFGVRVWLFTYPQMLVLGHKVLGVVRWSLQTCCTDLVTSWDLLIWVKTSFASLCGALLTLIVESLFLLVTYVVGEYNDGREL